MTSAFDELLERNRLEGQKAVLRRQFAWRYGGVPADVEARLASGSAADVSRWSIRILTVSSLAELFRPPEPPRSAMASRSEEDSQAPRSLLDVAIDDGLIDQFDRGVDGFRTVFRHLVAKAHGALPNEIEAQLASGDPVDLLVWLARFKAGRSLAEVFRPR